MNFESAESGSSDEEMPSFNIIKSITYDGIEHRLGRLAIQGRTPMQTPHYIAVTSRGPIPHIAPDMMRNHTEVNGVYVALEDCKLYIKRRLTAKKKLTCQLELTSC